MRLGSWQAEEQASLVQGVAQALQISAGGDQVEQIAMIARRGVGPFAGRAAAGFDAAQPDIETAAWVVVDVADKPVSAFAASIGQIVSADRLGVTRETVGQLSSRAVPCRSPVTLRHGGLPPEGRSVRADDRERVV